jgi:hypothetical protein
MRYPFVILLSLAGCVGEPASKWDSDQGRFRSTQDIRDEELDRLHAIERRLEKLEDIVHKKIPH